MIPYATQYIDEDDIQAVVDVLKGDWLTQGPKVEEFENALADYCGAKYAVAISSGTAALHLACLAAGIKNGDEVITTPITFAASANCVVYCSGKPVFADIDAETLNINPAEIEKKVSLKTKAVIPVHFRGFPCEMDAIKNIADKHNIVVIEDACHALGAEYRVRDEWFKVGSCRHSDMTVFSFHPVKHITTGEGGAVTTNSEELNEKLKLLRSHGITKNNEKFINKDIAFSLNPESLILNPNPWYYEMQELGFNYRITDIQCALGISQLEKIPSFVKRRREIAEIYNDAFKGLPNVIISLENEGQKSAYHLYVVQIGFENIGKSRLNFMNLLREQGIGTQVHYIPLHLQPYYSSNFGCKEGDFSASERYYKRALSIPLYPRMTDEEIEIVVSGITKLFN